MLRPNSVQRVFLLSGAEKAVILGMVSLHCHVFAAHS
jgi:hypothetical protein